MKGSKLKMAGKSTFLAEKISTIVFWVCNILKLMKIYGAIFFQNIFTEAKIATHDTPLVVLKWLRQLFSTSISIDNKSYKALI